MAVTLPCNLWPFSSFKDGDLTLSNHLVRALSIPEDTKKFVFAFRDPESHSVIYILSTLNLSKRSAFDAECLIEEIGPDAVVVQAGNSPWTEIQSEENELDASVPTSSFGVIKRCFVDKISKVKYENAAANYVLREIFETSFHGHLLAAKRVAEDVGSSFLVLESPPTTLKRFSFCNDIQSQMVKASCLLMDPPLHDHYNLASVEASEEIQPRRSYETPDFARAIYPLFEFLHRIFANFPPIQRSLAHVQKLLLDLNRGQNVDTNVVSEVYTFQAAIEGLRIALNNSGRQPISKKDISNSAKIKFLELLAEDKSHVILAQALRCQMDKFETVVAVVDAGCLAGIRKYWHTSLPAEVKELVEQAISNPEGEGIISNHKRSLRDKPMVAVGAGAAAVLGTSALKKLIPSSTFTKIISFTRLKLVLTKTQKATFRAKTSGIMKANASTGKFRTVSKIIIASAETISFVAKTAYFEMKEKVQQRPVGFLPWVTLACSVSTFAGLLLYGDGIECAVGSLPAAPSIATLGRGIQNLRQASQVVMQTEGPRIQHSIESLINCMKKAKAH